MVELVQKALALGFIREADSAVVLYDLDLLERRLAAVRQAFPPGTLHAVAVKANPLPPVLSFLHGLGAGAEVASLPELRLALHAGLPAERIVFDSPAKTEAELRLALALGVYVNADNFDELYRLEALGASMGVTPRAGLRVNPQVGPGRIKATSVAAPYSKFGVPLAQTPGDHGRLRQVSVAYGPACPCGVSGVPPGVARRGRLCRLRSGAGYLARKGPWPGTAF
ncbi:MAG: hypothetical protein AB9872_05470 [Solidesulfovibrio sp.]